MGQNTRSWINLQAISPPHFDQLRLLAENRQSVQREVSRIEIWLDCSLTSQPGREMWLEFPSVDTSKHHSMQQGSQTAEERRL